MDISEIRDRKHKLEKEIANLVGEFEKETECAISEFEVFRPIPYTGYAPLISDGEVELEFPVTIFVHLQGL